MFNLEPFYRYGAKVLVRLFWRVRFEGFKEQIPPTGPALLIANHISYLDGLMINAACPRPVRFVIDEKIYRTPGVYYFMRHNRAIPIAANRKAVRRALRAVTRALGKGELVCIFPEGSLTYTGNMRRFRFGIEWMVEQNEVPVIPIAIKGLWGSIFSRKYLGKPWPFLPRRAPWKQVVLVCGEPIPHEKAQINYLQKQLMMLKNKAEKLE